jgi:nitroreductase
MEFSDVIVRRKSTRKFTAEKLTPADLQLILYVANSSPIGSGLYKDIQLTVIQDNRELLKTLASAARTRMIDKKQREANEAISGDLKREISFEHYDPFYNAPTVVIVSHRKQDLQPEIEYANVTCVAYSIQLEATNLGLGSVFLWYVFESMRLYPEMHLEEHLKLKEGFEPLLGIALGYPENELEPRNLRTDRISVDFL